MATSSFLFSDAGVTLAGRMHRETGDPFERQPAVVVMGSWLTVKEQMADLYAAKLATLGYSAFTFDFAGFGASGGDLRQAELPTRKITNIAAAVRFVSSLSTVAPGGPAVVAVCASAQYALAAIALGLPVAAFASVAGWFHDAESVASFYGGADGVNERLARAATAADRYLQTGELSTVPAYAVGDQRAGMFIDMDYYANPDRGAIPAWTNEMAEVSWAHWLTFDGLSSAAAVDVPSLFVHSDECVFPDNVKAVAKAVSGPAELAWGSGAQIDFYDQPAQVSFAVDAVHQHLLSNLATGARA